MVKCPKCRRNVNVKPIKEWVLNPKGKKKIPKLHMKLYQHCGKKFRVVEKTRT